MTNDMMKDSRKIWIMNIRRTIFIRRFRLNNPDQGGPTSALLWATFQNYLSLRASAG